jgi:DNA-binding MarR family transcriptional regulator
VTTLATKTAPAARVLEERRDSPGLLLALLGSDAMRKLRHAHTEDGLSPQQFHLLALLHDQGPMGQSDLGAAVGTDPSVLVTRLNPLEAEGLISRTRDTSDRRRHVVVLTDSGAARLRAAAHAQQRAEDSLFSALDRDQREQLQTLLVTVRDSQPTGEPSPCKEDS